MTTEILSRRITVLPVLLDDCNLPFFLRDKVYADFRAESMQEVETERLIRSIRLAGAVSTQVQGSGTQRSNLPATVATEPAPLGQVVHDFQREYRGYRAARMEQHTGFLGIACFLLVALPSYIGNTEFPRALFLLASLCGGLGVCFMISGLIFERVFDKDKRLLLSVEEVGGWMVPFDQRWWRQYAAATNSKGYRVALYIETAGMLLGIIMASLVLYFLINPDEFRP